MNLLNAVEKAQHNENVRKLRGYFLGSVFASLTDPNSEIAEWTVLYYNQRTKTVVDCFVSDKFVTVGEETPAIKEIDELEIKNVKVDIKTVLGAIEKKFKKKSLNILISLQTKDFGGPKTVWTIAHVTPEMLAVSFDVDASTGSLLKETTTHLIKRV